MLSYFNTLARMLKGTYGYYRRRFVLDELIFAVTYKCNFRCGQCYYGRTMDAMAGSDAPELSLEEIGRVSSSLGRLKNLLISGGEPFLRDDLPEICELFYRRNDICHIHLPTNGFYTERIVGQTRVILEQLPHVDLTVGLSLDGLDENHDAARGKQGSFARVVETGRGLAGLKKNRNNLEIYIITVVTKNNVGAVVDLAEFIKENLPVDGHGPSPVRGTPYEASVLPPGYKDWDALARQLMPYHRFWNRKTSGSGLQALLATNRIRYLYGVYTRVLQGKGLPFRCRAGNGIGVLEPNGDVKLCELGGAIGNVRAADYDFKAIWLSGEADREREKAKHCACTHACFLSPSIALSLPATIKSSFCFKTAKTSEGT